MQPITTTTTRYKCQVCGSLYGTPEDAEKCEAQPVTYNKGAEVGDRIRVTTGQGAGQRHIVTKIFIIERDWGHYAWKRYWHTIGLTARRPGETGERMLTFDEYEII